MDENLRAEVIKGLIRHALTAVGGVFLANGTLSGHDVDLLAGAILTFGGVVWSVLHKQKKP